MTKTGERFYERCRIILAEAAAVDSLAEDVEAEPSGRLRIGAPVDYGALRLAPSVTGFLALRPAMEIELSIWWTKAMTPRCGSV